MATGEVSDPRSETDDCCKMFSPAGRRVCKVDSDVKNTILHGLINSLSKDIISHAHEPDIIVGKFAKEYGGLMPSLSMW